MKGKKLITLVLTSLAIGVLAACSGGGGSSEVTSSSVTPGPSSSSQEAPLPNEYSLMKYWAGNQAEECYTVVEHDNETIINYQDVTGEKAGGWQYVARSFAYDAAYVRRFSEYKKVSFTGKLETTAGSDVVMVKVEGVGGTFEKKFNFKSTSGTYEFSLAFVSDWTQVSSILFFVNRDFTESGSGKITLTNFVLSKDEVNPAYDIAPGMPDVPQDWNIYNGGDSHSVMQCWGYDATETITTTGTVEGYTFKYNGKPAGTEWAYVSAMIKGNDQHVIATAGFKRMAFEVVGVEGTHALFKFQTKDNAKAKELMITFTGAKQVVELDITAVLAASTNDEFLACIFPEGGSAGDTLVGEILLESAYLDKQEVYVEPVTCKTDFTTIFINAFDKVDPCFAVNTEGNKVTVQLSKSAIGWESIQALVKKTEDWFNLADYSRLYGVVTSDKDTHIMVKAYDSQEFKYELKAGVPVTIDETITATPDEAKVTPIFISMDEGDALDAKVVIDGLRFVKPTANIEVGDKAYITKSPTNDGKHVITSKETGMEIAYTKTAPGWEAVEFFTSGNYAALEYLSVTVTATVDTHILFKPADNGVNEKKLELKANVPQTIDYKFTPSDNITWACKHVLFVCTEEGDALEGTVKLENFMIHEAFAYANDYGSTFITNFFRADSCYNVIARGNTLDIAYEKAASGWESMAAHVTLGDTWYPIGDYTRVYAEIVADVDVKVLLKAYDNNAGEHWVSLKANEPQIVDYTVDASIALADKDFIVFICAGDDAGATKGNVSISGLRLMRAGANVEANGTVLVDSIAPKAGYTVSKIDDGMTVKYEKGEVGYDACEFFLSSTRPHEFNHVSITISADKATHVLLKPFDNNTNEKSIELAAGVSQTVEFDVTPAGAGQWACKQVMFFATTAGDALSATVSITNFIYSVK